MTFRISFTKFRNNIIMDGKKTAIIIWSNWQDWKLLSSFLEKKDYNIVWISKEDIYSNNIPLETKKCNILNSNEVFELLNIVKPDELYYLAAYHHSSQDVIPNNSELLKSSTDIHVNWYFNILESAAKCSSQTKICYASSCLIYWWSETTKQDEKTLPAPNSIYAITKLQWMYLSKFYTEKYSLQIINAILYNHESEYRSEKFVSMKVIQGAINISKWLQENIILGDLSTQVDWWYAWDYIEAMYWLLQSDKKWDYIISSWELHTIQELVEIVFWYLKLDWRKYIISDSSILHRNNWLLFWNNAKIKNDINRKQSMSFRDTIIYILEQVK